MAIDPKLGWYPGQVALFQVPQKRRVQAELEARAQASVAKARSATEPAQMLDVLEQLGSAAHDEVYNAYVGTPVPFANFRGDVVRERRVPLVGIKFHTTHKNQQLSMAEVQTRLTGESPAQVTAQLFRPHCFSEMTDPAWACRAVGEPVKLDDTRQFTDWWKQTAVPFLEEKHEPFGKPPEIDL